jgi:hypothetical protein
LGTVEVARKVTSVRPQNAVVCCGDGVLSVIGIFRCDRSPVMLTWFRHLRNRTRLVCFFSVEGARLQHTFLILLSGPLGQGGGACDQNNPYPLHARSQRWLR